MIHDNTRKTFDQIKKGSRVMDPHLLRGTVKHIYPYEPIKGAVIEWDNDSISWPNDIQINKMRVIEDKENE